MIKPEVLIRIPAEASETAVTAFCLLHLQGLGYNVTSPHALSESPTQFLTRLGLNKESLRRALNRPGCPHANVTWSKGGNRIMAIQSNPDFDAFCSRHSKGK